MRKFWSHNEELTPPEQRLVAALYAAHAACVHRENCSTMALIQAAGGSRSLTQSYIAALATLGEIHGPIEDAYKFLAWDGSWKDGFILGKISGWGNSFIKGRIDDAFLPVDQILEAQFPRSHSRLREITDALHARGNNVFPNPAAYTAAVALVLNMPRHLAPMLFVQARLEAWASVFHTVVIQCMKPEQKERAA